MVIYYTPLLAALIALAPAAEMPKSPAPLQEVHIKENVPNEPDSLGYNCVAYVRSRGAVVPQGGIANLVPNSLPRVGGIVIMHYPRAWHVAYIEAIDAQGIHIAESNVEPGKIQRRVIRPTYPHIVGYGWY